jgi:hypothetical protein
MGVVETTQASGNTFPVVNIKYLEVGQQVDLKVGVTSADRAANRQITAINETTRVVTLDGAAFVPTAGDILVRQGNWNREVTGLAALVTATGTLFNIDPTVQPLWKATVDSNGGVNRPISEGLLTTLTDKVRLKGGKTSVLITSLGVRRAYFNLLSQQRRFTGTKEFAGGITALTFSNGRDIPFVEDVDAPDNTIYALDESKIKVYQDHDFKWMQRDGNIWKWVTDYDAYEAVMSKYWEIATNQRNAHAVATDVTEG